jgi:hypothetical protein
MFILGLRDEFRDGLDNISDNSNILFGAWGSAVVKALRY